MVLKLIFLSLVDINGGQGQESPFEIIDIRIDNISSASSSHHKIEGNDIACKDTIQQENDQTDRLLPIDDGCLPEVHKKGLPLNSIIGSGSSSETIRKASNASKSSKSSSGNN